MIGGFMENQRFYEALENGEFQHLEELAQNAGYIDDFNIMYSKILSVKNDKNLTFWRSTGHLDALETAPSLAHRLQIEGYIQENPPRIHWNKEYKNLFTRVKENEESNFVDCWTDKNLGLVAFSAGKFPRKGENGYHDDCDKETNRILHLSTIRSKYP